MELEAAKLQLADLKKTSSQLADDKEALMVSLSPASLHASHLHWCVYHKHLAHTCWSLGAAVLYRAAGKEGP